MLGLSARFAERVIQDQTQNCFGDDLHQTPEEDEKFFRIFIVQLGKSIYLYKKISLAYS